MSSREKDSYYVYFLVTFLEHISLPYKSVKRNWSKYFCDTPNTGKEILVEIWNQRNISFVEKVFLFMQCAV